MELEWIKISNEKWRDKPKGTLVFRADEAKVEIPLEQEDMEEILKLMSDLILKRADEAVNNIQLHALKNDNLIEHKTE